MLHKYFGFFSKPAQQFNKVDCKLDQDCVTESVERKVSLFSEIAHLFANRPYNLFWGIKAHEALFSSKTPPSERVMAACLDACNKL